MGKKRLILYILTIPLILISCAGVAEDLLRAPDLRIANVRVANLSPANQNLVFTIALDNPNPIPIPIKGLTYRLDLNGVEFASGFNESDISIPAGGNSIIDLNIEGNLLSFIQQLGGFRDDGLSYKLSGDIALLSSSIRFPYSQGGKLKFASIL